MTRSYDREVPPIDGGDLVDAQPLGECDHGGVGRAERKISILTDEVCHTAVIASCQLNRFEGAISERAQKRGLDLRRRLPRQQIANLGNHQRRQNEISSREMHSGEQLDGFMVMDVGVERSGHQGTCITDQHPYWPNPSASSWSTRSDVSRRRPVAAPNHAGGQGISRTGCKCLRTSSSTCGTSSSGNCRTRRSSSCLSDVTFRVYRVDANQVAHVTERCRRRCRTSRLFISVVDPGHQRRWSCRRRATRAMRASASGWRTAGTRDSVRATTAKARPSACSTTPAS